MQQTSDNSCKPSGARDCGHRIFALIFAMALTLLPGQSIAKVYFTPDKAQKICFPKADRFEQKTVRYSGEQMKAIKKASGVEVQIPGTRYALAWQGKQLAGVVVFDYVLGKSEVIDYCIALTPDGVVKQVEILQYRESHGYEIRRPGWRKQFSGKTSTANLHLHDDIANISGATISCRNITSGVKRVLHTWHLVLRPTLLAAGRLSVDNK